MSLKIVWSVDFSPFIVSYTPLVPCRKIFFPKWVIEHLLLRLVLCLTLHALISVLCDRVYVNAFN